MNADLDNSTPDRPPFRKAVRWAYIMTLGQRGIALLLTFILAALLGPGDFGAVAMAMAYIVLIEMFVNQGMSSAIIQRKDLNDSHLDATFWLTTAAGIALAGLSVALSGWWAQVNDLPLLRPVIIVLSLSIPIKGLTVVQLALLQRRMDFRNLALLRAASSIVGGCAGVSMALLGCGVWSLVAQQLISSAIATVIIWAVSDWRPRLRFSPKHARSLLGFSGGAFASQLGAYLASQSDAILMGLLFGPVAVGLYRLAERIMSALLEVATRSIQVVALPHFSRFQDDPAGLRKAVLSCLRISATLTIPAMAVLAACSDELMAVLGEKWSAAGTVLKVIVIMGMVKAVVLFNGPLLFALSRPGTVAVLIWSVGLATAGGIAAVGVLMRTAATEMQVMGVALTRLAIFAIPSGAAFLVITTRLCGIPLRQLAGAIAPGVGGALTALAVAAAISAAGVPSGASSAVALLSVALPATACATLMLLILDPRLRRGAAALLRSARPPRSRQARTQHPFLRTGRLSEKAVTDA